MDIHIKLWTYQNAFKYTENQKGQFALEAYQSIIDDGVQTKHYTFVCLFKACDTIDSHEEGKNIYEHASRNGYYSDGQVGSSIVRT